MAKLGDVDVKVNVERPPSEIYRFSITGPTRDQLKVLAEHRARAYFGPDNEGLIVLLESTSALVESDATQEVSVYKADAIAYLSGNGERFAAEVGTTDEAERPREHLRVVRPRSADDRDEEMTYVPQELAGRIKQALQRVADPMSGLVDDTDRAIVEALALELIECPNYPIGV